MSRTTKQQPYTGRKRTIRRGMSRREMKMLSAIRELSDDVSEKDCKLPLAFFQKESMLTNQRKERRT